VGDVNLGGAAPYHALLNVLAAGASCCPPVVVEYLGELASALGLGAREVNAIHSKLGIPALYN
jgi:hypothetical protein